MYMAGRRQVCPEQHGRSGGGVEVEEGPHRHRGLLPDRRHGPRPPPRSPRATIRGCERAFPPGSSGNVKAGLLKSKAVATAEAE
jgi:hypothetical protein